MHSERGSGSSGNGGTKVITRRVEAGPLLDPNDVIATTKHEEWTTKKKVVNHKTKQVETRVQRQLVLEDGKVVADSGPTVTTKTTEDNKTEETENTEHKKTADDPPDDSYVSLPGSARVVSEKTESHQTMKETKEENMKLHDENIRELNGPEIHRKSLVLTPGDSPFYSNLENLTKNFPGKLTHYSSKSQKITDKEEVKETSETKNGEMTTNSTRTHHHEEVHDDEVPEDETLHKALNDGDRFLKRLTYRPVNKDEEEMDSLSDKLRKERELNIIRDIAMERRDPVTKKALSIEEEEEIRNSETNRWLENHFGSSDESDIVETNTRTKAGGNVINISMTSTSKRPPTVPKLDRVDSTKNVYVSKINNSEEYITPKSYPTVGNRFCATPREPDVIYTTLRTPTPNSQPSRFRESPLLTDNYSTLSSSNRTPLKTYFLGQEGPYRSGLLNKYESTSLRRQSAPWKSTPTLNADINGVNISTFENRLRSRNSDSRPELRTSKSPVQRSMSHRDISPRQQIRSRISTQDDAIIHKFSSNDYLNDSPPNWLSSKTLPRGAKLNPHKLKNGEQHKYRTSFSEVQTFKNGKKTDRSIQVELSDDEDNSRSTLSRMRSPSPGDTDLFSLPTSHSSRRKGIYSPISTPTKTTPSKQFYFGDATRDDYRKSYGKTNGTSTYSDGYGSLPSSKERYVTIERETNGHGNIDKRMASFSSYGKSSDRSFDADSPSFVDYSRSQHYRSSPDGALVKEERYRTEETRRNNRNNRKNSHYLHSDCDYDRHQQQQHNWNGKVNANDRRHFIDALLTNQNGEGVYSKRYERRQRHGSGSPGSSPVPRLIRADRYSGSSSLSPPASPVAPPPPPPPPPTGTYGTWSKQHGKVIRTHSPVTSPPNFTPLMSPSEIKNMANAFSRRHREETLNKSPKYMEVKPGAKTGTVVVEVRDWGNR